VANVPYDQGAGQTTEAQVSVGDDYQHINANPSQFGATIATGLQQFGQGAVKASQFYDQVSADDVTNNYFDQTNKRLYGDPSKTTTGPDGQPVADTGFFGLKGAAQMAARPALQQAMDQDLQNYRSQLKTPEAQLEFDRNSRRYRTMVMERVGVASERAMTQYGMETTVGQAHVALTEVSNNAYDDNAFNHGLADLTNAYLKRVDLQGLGPVGAQAAKDQALADAWRARLETMGVHDPAKAAALADQHQKELGVAYEPIANSLRARADAQAGEQAGKAAVQSAQAGQLPLAHPSHPVTASAVGATGYGAINAPYRAPLDAKGEGGIVSPAEHFQWLKAHGASDNEALMLTGAAANESSFNANAKHDPRNGAFTGHGLYGHNDGRLDMRGKDWQQQSLAALQELRSRPESRLVNSAQTPEQLAIAEMHYEAPRGFSPENPKAGDNFTGRLNTIRYFSQMTKGVFNGTNGAPATAYAQQGPSSHQAVAPDGTPISNASFTKEGVALPPVDQAPSTVVTPPEGTPLPQSAPPAPPSPEQVKAAALAAIENNPDLSDAAKQHAQRTIIQQVAEQEIIEGANAKARKEQEEKSAGGYVTRMLTGQGAPGIAQEIANDPTLTWQTKEHLYDAVKKYTGNDSEQAGLAYGPGFWKYYRQVTAPVGDPERITDPMQFLSHAGPNGDLTLAGVQKLMQTVGESRKSVDSESINRAKSSILQGMKERMSFDQTMLIPGLPQSMARDPKGEQIFNLQAVPQFEAAFDAWTKAGKDPWEFLNDTKRFEDMATRLRPPQQMAMDKMVAAGGMAEPANMPLPPPPQGIRPEIWQPIVAAPPVAPDGLPVSHYAWSQVLSALAANPTPETVAQIKASKFGKLDVDWNKIATELTSTQSREAPAPPHTHTPDNSVRTLPGAEERRRLFEKLNPGG